MDIGPVELVLIVVIVVMLFGVGKLPEVFGSVGKGLREFRREMNGPGARQTPEAPKSAPPTPAAAAEEQNEPV